MFWFFSNKCIIFASLNFKKRNYMDMLLLIIISLGAFCACFNLYSVIVGDKSDKTMKQTEEIIVKKKDGTVLDFNLTQIQIGNKQKTIIELKED